MQLGTLFSFQIANKFYLGQLLHLSPSGDIAHILCIAPSSKYQGKEFIRYMEDVEPVRNPEEMLMLGIDKNTQFVYDVPVSQKQMLREVQSLLEDTNFEVLKSKIEKEKREMLIKKSVVPVLVKGRGTGGPSVSVRENGQVAFSTEAGKVFEGKTHLVIDWDASDRTMSFKAADAAKPPKGMTKEDLFQIMVTKNGDQKYLNIGGVLKFEGIEYDYKAAGTHSFTAELEGDKVSFTLPIKMEMKPKTPRKPKAKGEKVDMSGTGSAAGAAETKEDELEIKAA